MSRILITGDAGFIGYHAARRFLALGHEVQGYDGLTEYYDVQLKRDRLARLNSPHFTHITGMLEDRDALEGVIKQFHPDAVIHLAAQAGVRYGIDHPNTYINTNVVGTFNLLEAVRKYPVKHLMLASSSSIYGGNTKIPFAETDRADAPVSLYAATKKSTEALAHSTSHLWGVPITALRFFTVYGPWGRPDMALFKFVHSIETGEPIDVYGFGRMRRDFTYVDDIVDGVVALLDCPPTSGQPVSVHDSLSAVAPYRSVNIAGGSAIGLLEYIETIEDALGKKATKHMLPMQAGDVEETFADPTLLKELVGTIPKTSVRLGVGSFVSWYRDYFSGRELA